MGAISYHRQKILSYLRSSGFYTTPLRQCSLRPRDCVALFSTGNGNPTVSCSLYLTFVGFFLKWSTPAVKRTFLDEVVSYTYLWI